MSFRAVPLSREQANAFIAVHHRHHKPSVGDKFRVGAELDGRLVGVAVVGRPIARCFDNGTIVEVTRLCTDGTPNACSFLYSRCARIAREFGYAKIITYILGTEPGVSLVASGWVMDKEVPGREWSCPSRPRQTSAPACDKQRWVKVLTDNPAPVDFPKEAPRRAGHVSLSLLCLS